MPNIALTYGERYTFAKQGTVTVITDSTDSAEGTKIINNNLTLSGSASRKIRIETATSTNDAHVHFKSSTTDFSAGVNGGENSFEIGTNTSLAGPGSTSTALRIPDVASPKVHFDWGIVVSGSASVAGSASVNGTLSVTGSAQISNNAFDATTYSYVMTTASTASAQSTTWSIPSNTADRMFYVFSQPQYSGSNLTGTSPYLQITTEFTSLGYIAFHETNSKPQYNHSFLIPAGIACTVVFDKGATTKSSAGNLEWKGKSIKLGG